jgi:hypothetical protein
VACTLCLMRWRCRWENAVKVVVLGCPWAESAASKTDSIGGGLQGYLRHIANLLSGLSRRDSTHCTQTGGIVKTGRAMSLVAGYFSLHVERGNGSQSEKRGPSSGGCAAGSE